jgi:Calcineurin-like phosphoesterase
MRRRTRRAACWALALVLQASSVGAADLPGAWTELEADGRLSIRIPVAPGGACPGVTADGAALPTAIRAEPGPDFPLRLCAARAEAGARDLAVDGLPAPGIGPSLNRILLIGDTGCRLKGRVAQGCNVPAAWPFAELARRAALRRPDLVIHVGDYHYREAPCPQADAGCAGSPFGDNWAVWRRDFFDPAAPLLAQAPWVMVRGNHELCGRGGHGWFRLLDPHPQLLDCPARTEPYALRLPGLDLLVFDSADADDHAADPVKVAEYRRQLQSLLAQTGSRTWLLTHRPVWALTEGEDLPLGPTLNLTQQAAIHGLIPPSLDMIVSGHVHDFAAYSFGPDRPAQLIVGSGGDKEDDIVQDIAPGTMIDGMAVHRASGLSDFGYLLLERDGPDWTGSFYSVADAMLARCSFSGREIACETSLRSH